jgi:hypothetical protein
MSEEISAGVRILLERAKSNPEEMAQEYGKWHQLRDAVYAYKEDGQRRAWIRGLRQDEIDLLYEAFCTGSRQIFDDYVLKNVLGADEEEKQPVDAYTLAQGKRAMQPPVKVHNYNPHQNAIQPGSWQNVTLAGNTVVQGTFDAEPSPSFVQKIKKELGL